jgi:conjugative transfer signal peptidase TraF
MHERFALLRITGELKPWPRSRRRRPPRRRATISLMSLGVAALGAAGVLQPTPRLIWNASASAPLGIYWVTRDETISRGDLVLAELPDAARHLAAERGYLPSGVPIVKHVAAISDDFVCANSGIVVINNRVAADTLLIDRQGRPLPAWTACRMLTQGEVFLLNEGVRASFDGRYFGPVNSSAIIGSLVPLWIW